MDRKPLSDQVVVVFGASSGIGRATALEAARRGARVVGAARDRQALESLAVEAAPAEIVVGTADVADVGGAAKLQLFVQKPSPRLMDGPARASTRFLRSDEPRRPGEGDALYGDQGGDDRVRGVVSTTRR